MEASAATIRNHLKALMDEGLLVQAHTSGGRMPSLVAMQAFWAEKLSEVQNTQIATLDTLKNATREYQISVSIKFYEPNELKNIINVEDRFVVAEFERGDILFAGGEDLYRFLQEFIGYDILSIKAAAESFGVGEVLTKIAKFLAQKTSKVQIVNPEALMLLAQSDAYWAQNFLPKFMNGYILMQANDGLYFENIVPLGFAALKTEAKIEEKNAQMLCVGHLSRDFGGFLAYINQ
jgi:heat-inducible transcriptional repressor